MKNDLKKKFLDILFEPIDEDDVNVIAEDKITDVIKPVAPKVVKKEAPVTKVETITLTKQEVKEEKKQSSFIDVTPSKPKEKEVKKVEPVPVKEEEFVLDNNVSPIFGVDKDKKTYTPSIDKPKRKENTVSQIYTEFTGQVISPIFGLDNARANEARTGFNEKHIAEEKECVDTDVTEDLELFSNEDTGVEEVQMYEEPISLFDEPFDLPKVDEDIFNEPFTEEIRIIKEDAKAEEEISEEDDKDIDVEFYEIKDSDIIPETKQTTDQKLEDSEEYKTADLIEIKKELLSNIKESAQSTKKEDDDNVLDVEVNKIDYDKLVDKTRDDLFDDLLGD